METNRNSCSLLVAVLVALVIILGAVYLLYRRFEADRFAPPARCDGYPAGLAALCGVGKQACATLDTARDRAACDAAVGACLDAVDSGDVAGCGQALQKMSPAGAAAAYTAAARKLGASPELTPAQSDFFKDPLAQKAVSDAAHALADTADWLMDFGAHLPVAAEDAPKTVARFTPGPVQDCGPLCRRPECYADEHCHAGGACLFYFLDNPTQGGQCVPH